MKVLYDDCLDAIKNDKCSECNDNFQCSVSGYIEQKYQQGRADGIDEFIKKMGFCCCSDTCYTTKKCSKCAYNTISEKEVLRLAKQLKEQ